MSKHAVFEYSATIVPVILVTPGFDSICIITLREFLTKMCTVRRIRYSYSITMYESSFAQKEIIFIFLLQNVFMVGVVSSFVRHSY